MDKYKELSIRSIRMTQDERSALITYVKEFVNGVDPILLVNHLLHCGQVSHSLNETVQLFYRKCRSRVEISRHLFEQLPYEANFNDLILCLHKCGYSRLGSCIFMQAFRFGRLTGVQRQDSSERKNEQIYYRNLKRMVHDSQFQNPRNALRKLAKRNMAAFQRESDEFKRQKIADRCVSILAVEIDADYDSLACKQEVSQQEMLEEMKTLIPFTSNTSLNDTIYFSRQANRQAYHKDLESSQNMLKQARCSAHNIGTCLELVNLLYIEVYVKLWELELNPSRHVLDQILMWGRIGLESLEDISEDIRVMWKRMFILRMVFGLLGIANRANLIDGFEVDRVNLPEAESLLASVDRNWNGIEVRREMFYCMARARLCEQHKEINTAIVYIDRAIGLAEQGKFLEKIPNLKNFKTSLERSYTRTLLSPLSVTGSVSSVYTSVCTSTNNNVPFETPMLQMPIANDEVEVPSICDHSMNRQAKNFIKNCTNAHDYFHREIGGETLRNTTNTDPNLSDIVEGKYLENCRHENYNEPGVSSITFTKVMCSPKGLRRENAAFDSGDLFDDSTNISRNDFPFQYDITNSPNAILTLRTEVEQGNPSTAIAYSPDAEEIDIVRMETFCRLSERDCDSNTALKGYFLSPLDNNTQLLIPNSSETDLQHPGNVETKEDNSSFSSFQNRVCAAIGSIALFEDREDPEGTSVSIDDQNVVNPVKTKPSRLKSELGTQNHCKLDGCEDHKADDENDINDEDLFGY